MHIKYEFQKGIGTVTFTRADKLNSFTLDMWRELYEILIREKANRDLRVLVITGEGRAFSAGNDIKEMDRLKESEDLIAFFADGFAKVLREISEFPVPTIGGINGLAYGGGFEMTLMFDIVIASRNAKFAFPEVNIGLIPPAGLTIGPSIIGLKKAAWLTLVGEPISAEEAQELGIVDFVTEPEEFLEKIHEVAGKIVKADPIALRIAKKWIARQRNMVFFEEASMDLVFLANTKFARDSLARFLKKK